MKKLAILFLVAGAMFCVSSAALADTNNESAPGSTITLDDGASPAANELELNFSPGVIGQYNADTGGTPNNIQWFSIATYHGGGNMFYGTTSGITSIYKKERLTDETLGDAAIPDQQDDQEGEVCTEDDPPVCTPYGWEADWTK
jgi:hypothetical protein